MKQSLSLVSASLVVFLAAAYLVPSTWAQDGGDKVRVDRISAQKIQTPQYKYNGPNFPNVPTRQWYQIVTKYRTAPEWLDEVNFTYYVHIKGKKKDQKPDTLLRGYVDNINVAKGRHESVMYLHPSTLDRMGDVERVAVLIHSQGQLLAWASDPSAKDRWWEKAPPKDGYLMKRTETPFAPLAFDAYEAMKAGAPRR